MRQNAWNRRKEHETEGIGREKGGETEGMGWEEG
jgi:hypothetical protein